MEIPVGYAQANLRFTGTGLPTGAEVTIGFDISDYANDPDQAAQDIADFWNGNEIDTQVPATVVLSEVSIKYGPTATGPTGVWTGSIAGTKNEQQMQPGTALLVHKVTALGGRAGRGRFYHPGVTEETVTAAGELTSGALADWQNVMGDFYDSLVLVNLDPVVLHSEGSPISTPTPITAFTVDPKVATQRRRLRR